MFYEASCNIDLAPRLAAGAKFITQAGVQQSEK
jgi:hypothetical protein